MCTAVETLAEELPVSSLFTGRLQSTLDDMADNMSGDTVRTGRDTLEDILKDPVKASKEKKEAVGWGVGQPQGNMEKTRGGELRGWGGGGRREGEERGPLHASFQMFPM